MIGVIGDMHFKDVLSYSDYVKDQRRKEENDTLDAIVEYLKDCSTIVFMGDQLHQKNNTSEVNRKLVAFVERFGEKDLFILSGNHEKKGDGSTAIDFLREVSGKRWNIITKPYIFGKITFLPFMLKSELESDTDEKALEVLMEKHLPGGDILFAHHAISDTLSYHDISTNLFKEIVLPRRKLLEKYKLLVGGHIHRPYTVKKDTLVTGSVFTADVGEDEKYVWKILKNLSIEKFKLPSRGIYRLEDPSDIELDKLQSYSIVKVLITKRGTDIEVLKKKLERFDASLVVEDYPSERKKIHMVDGAFDFSIPNLLKIYAEERDIPYDKLNKGMELLT